jgi:hypothetical protein
MLLALVLNCCQSSQIMAKSSQIIAKNMFNA